jgi:hypothetical protein
VSNLAAVEFSEGLALDLGWRNVVPTLRSWMGPNTRRDVDAHPRG